MVAHVCTVSSYYDNDYYIATLLKRHQNKCDFLLQCIWPEKQNLAIMMLVLHFIFIHLFFVKESGISGNTCRSKTMIISFYHKHFKYHECRLMLQRKFCTCSAIQTFFFFFLWYRMISIGHRNLFI